MLFSICCMWLFHFSLFIFLYIHVCCAVQHFCALGDKKIEKKSKKKKENKEKVRKIEKKRERNEKIAEI